ncbi:MAG: hypothetical protein RLZZ292_2667 [Bacteroidota bacterium]|jgi:hypothetical protein
MEELEDVKKFNFNLNHNDNLNEIAQKVKESQKLHWGTFYTFGEDE